ncbi:hypothetical protein ACK8P5_26145 (plasmid) [Paenibacillus sp. EC2-1]|uniref:hypothetical protein n=1 Tax=Paenibacillus sp. EC2-1 TaxID=3388665 RepID=UPI003BEF1262
MPFTWLDPEILLTYRGINVYHTYKNDNINDRSYLWYSLNDDGSEAFDVRDLTTPSNIATERHDFIIMRAIDEGELNQFIADSEQAGDLRPFDWPENWDNLSHHILVEFITQYHKYVDEESKEGRRSSKWKPISLYDFFDGPFRMYAYEREWLESEIDEEVND